jgi:hypothetical protein
MLHGSPRCRVEAENLANPRPRRVVALKECGPPALLVAGEGYVLALAEHPGDDQTEALRASPVVRGSA